jgi:uncharacterized repeat protein (TIGR01451 family)
MRRLLLAICVTALAVIALLPVTPASAQGSSADLVLTMTWDGHGKPRAQVGQFVSYHITVTNNGPDTAVGTLLFAAVSDQFNPVALNCADYLLCNEPGLDLAAGATITATFVAQVCCFGKGEVRNAFAVASVSSSTDDPNLDNNRVSVTTTIIGGRGR